MSKPIPGKPYTVKKGDNLSRIAAAAYGNGREWRKIWKANQQNLRSNDPNLIFPGEIINIPGPPEEIQKIERELAPTDLPGKETDEFTIVVNDREIPVKSGRILRSIDTAADGWSCVLAWETGTTDYDKYLKPYGYQRAQAYLGGKLVVSGALYTVGRSFGTTGIVGTLEGWSYTADIVDSNIKPPYEVKKTNLEDRAKELLEPYSIPLVFELDNDEPFDKLTCNATDTIFDHLLSLAKQRGGLVTCNTHGDLLITKASADSKPVATLTEGVPPMKEGSVRWDGRTRYNSYKVISQTPKRKTINAVAKDEVVTRPRFLTITAQDSNEGEVKEAAKWERSKRIADTLAMSVPVDTWYIPGTSELWQPNTIVTIVSPTLRCLNGFNFLIRSCEYEFATDGIRTKLDLVPPSVYTGETVGEPWL
jgi:prophage tail gpP-like protein